METVLQYLFSTAPAQVPSPLHCLISCDARAPEPSRAGAVGLAPAGVCALSAHRDLQQAPRLAVQQGGSPVTVNLPQPAARLHGLGWSSKNISAEEGLARQIPNQGSSIAQPHHRHGPKVLSPAAGLCWWHRTSLQPPVAKPCSQRSFPAPALCCSRQPLTLPASRSHCGLQPGFRILRCIRA